MKFLKEFSYPDIFQRRIILFNVFSSFLLLGMISFHLALHISSFTPYESAMRTILLGVLTGLFAGNLAGKAAFRISAFRAVYITAELLFLSMSCFYFYRWVYAGTPNDPLLKLYFSARPWLFLCLAVFAFFPGLKLNYFLKAAAGEYIDEKRPIYRFLLIIALASALGAATAQAAIAFPSLYPACAVLVLVILPSVFLIKTPYSPEPLLVQDFKEASGDERNAREEGIRRDDLFFTYLNSSYILVYCLLAYENICKFSGSWSSVKVLYFIVLLTALCAGFLCARLVKAAFWHIYTAMLFPVIFILFIVLTYTQKSTGNPLLYMLYFVPLALLLGFSLYHAIRNIVTRYDHRRRFLILDFSLFILPFPIFVVFMTVELTNLWFFVLFYAVALMNIVFPGIHLLQRPIAGYKKIVYFIFVISVIPLVIFVHLYFRIPLTSRLYVEYTAGFETLQGINTHQEFIRQNARVLFNSQDAFICNDSTVKNLQRAVYSVLLFSRDAGSPTRPVLVLDGNQAFFRNPALGQFKSMRCIDYVSDRSADYHRLPVSGRQPYFSEKSELYSFLFESGGVYETICDMPNLYDQSFDTLRFSDIFYGMIKTKLAAGGLFAQVFSVSGCRPEFFASACGSIKANFARTAIFLFSDQLVVLASDSADTLSISKNGIDRIRALLKEHAETSTFLLSEYHLLSHFFPGGAGDFTVLGDPPASAILRPAFRPAGGISIDEQLMDAYLNGTAEILGFVDKSPLNFEVATTLPAALNMNAKTLTLLKKAELAAARMEYESEADFLSQLKTISEYNAGLRTYVNRLYAHKEEYYFSEALKFEKAKRWDESSRLYRAILKINPAHFEANYRMGILSITLQNLDDAFKYLQRAMDLKRDDPKVLYQMGVLQFSSGQSRQALEYFTRVLELRESPESVYHYMGLCYEKLGRPDEAKTYYEKAMMADPNDSAIQSSLERVNQVLQARRTQQKPQDRKNQFEAEQGENIPLPINQTAKDIRLKDSEIPPEETDPAKQQKK